jgi:hypothetical protein
MDGREGSGERTEYQANEENANKQEKQAHCWASGHCPGSSADYHQGDREAREHGDG